MSFEPIGGHDKPDDTQLKLYGMLVDQLQKHTAIFWQFPLALAAANFFVLDKFLPHPKLLFGLFLMDLALVYAFHWEIRNQRAIISASQSAERWLRSTNYWTFIPQFRPKRMVSPKASNVIVWTLWGLTVCVLLLSLCGQSMQYAEVSALKSLYEYADLLKAQKRGDEAAVRAKANELRKAKTKKPRSAQPGNIYLSFVPSDELKDYANLLQELHRGTEADAVRALARGYQYTQEGDVCSCFSLLYWLKTWVD